MNKREQPESSNRKTASGNQSEALAKPYPRRPANKPAAFTLDSSTNPRRSVELYIDELVLNGFDPASRYRIGEALERELTRLFTELGTPPAITRDLETEHLNGGVFELRPGSDAEAIGIELAKAVYGGFSQ